MLTKNEPGGPQDAPTNAGNITPSRYKKSKKVKQSSEIVIDPDRQPLPDSVKEEKERHAAFAFGRFNPPTVGHEKLIHKVESVAKEHNASAHVITSHSEGSAKNPLPQKAKIGYLKKVASKSTHVTGSSKEHPTFLQHAAELHKQGVTHLHMIAGSDRVNEYKEKLHKYNGTHEGALFNFKHISVHSAGQRDPDAEGTEGMSGTKMRAAAHAGDKAKFKSGLPKALHPHAEEIANHIRAIKEDLDEAKEADYGGDYQSAVLRFKQKAKEQEAKKPTDINDLARRLHAAMKADTDKTKSQKLKEAVVSMAGRLKRATVAKRNKAKLAAARRLAQRRSAGNKQIRRRALKIAKKILRMRAAGKRGGAYSKLSISDRIAIDTLVKDKSKVIQSIAKKIQPRVKQRDIQRLSGAKQTSIPMNMSYEPQQRFRTIIAEAGLEENFLDEVMAKILAEKMSEITPTTLQGMRIKNTKEKQVVGVPSARKAQIAMKQILDPSKSNQVEELSDKDIKALSEKAESSGVPVDVLKQIFARGIAAAKTFKPKNSTPQQQAYARINSFIKKGKSFKDDDSDLAEDMKGFAHFHTSTKRGNEVVSKVDAKVKVGSGEYSPGQDTSKPHVHVVHVARNVEKIVRVDKPHDPEKDKGMPGHVHTVLSSRRRQGEIQRKVIEHRIDPLQLSAKLKKKLDKLPRQADVDKVLHRATKDVEERIHRQMSDDVAHGFSKKPGEED